MNTDIPLVSGLQGQVSSHSEIRIGEHYYPLERWLAGMNCQLEDLEQAPAISGVGVKTRVIVKYSGMEPADSVAELLADNMEDDVELQCVCVSRKVL